jgi:hypothetical protein
MSLFARLVGWKQVLRYQIAFDRPKTGLHLHDAPTFEERQYASPWFYEWYGEQLVSIDPTRVSVRVEPLFAEMPTEEYIRLWASYEAKILFNLAYNPQSAGIAMRALEMAQLRIGDDADCLKPLGWGERLRVVDKVPETHSVYTGEFYARGGVNRMIQTHFPRPVDDLQVAISGIALLHHAVVANRGNAYALCVLARTALNLSLASLDTAASVAQVPIRAYRDALAAC